MTNAIYAVILLSVATLGHSTRPEINVYRDSYGVPSIVAPSSADAMFALGYLHFVDAGERASLNYKIARGRSAEVLGRGQLIIDSFLRGFEIEDRAEKAELPPAAWAEIDAYIAGANKAIAERKGKLPKWVQPITRTDVLSLTQFINCAFPLLDLSGELMPGVGSNQFAIGSKRSATGHPILSMDPHLEWNGNDGGIVWYESGIYCPDLNFRGVSVPGSPGCVMGHNDRLAWSMTNNDPKLYVRYTVKTNPEKPTQYSYHGEWREFRIKKIELKFLENGELKTQNQTLKLTDWGPMVPFKSESVFLEPLGNFAAMTQIPKMMRAGTVQEFRKALNDRGLSMWNLVAADTNGGLAYQYNATLHQRDALIDWYKPVDGSDPKSKLGPLWTLDELPHSVNPSSALLVNANSSPWLTPGDNSMSKTWPAYVTTYGPTTRSLRLEDLLTHDASIDPNEAQRIATDTLVPNSDRLIRRLKDAKAAGEAFDILSKWNRKADVDTVGTALYLYVVAQNPAILSRQEPKAEELTDALKKGAEALKVKFGKLDVKWGEFLRMQRAGRSIGVSGWNLYGGAAVNPSGPGRGLGKLDGSITATRGSSFRMIVSLDPGNVQSWSILPYGNAQDPASPYYANQMRLFAVGRYKPTLFGVENAKKGATETIVLNR